MKTFFLWPNRHPSDDSKFGWRDSCPAKNAACKECKTTGHFMNMPACKAKKVSCIKVEKVHSTTSTNMITVKALGPETSIPVEVEADTGANITVVKAEVLQELDWVKLSPTDVHIRGYSGIAEPCLGKATVNLKMKNRCHKEDIFFSHKTTSNFLSRDACKAFGIIPKGFPHEQLNSVKSR